MTTANTEQTAGVMYCELCEEYKDGVRHVIVHNLGGMTYSSRLCPDCAKYTPEGIETVDAATGTVLCAAASDHGAPVVPEPQPDPREDRDRSYYE
jgi:hypothetical protein